jgi:DNA-binding NtrC family response regulator
MKKKPTLLIIDDEEPIRDALELVFSAECELSLAANAEEGLAAAAANAPTVALVDITLGNGESGVWLLKQLRQAHPHCQVIMVTADHRLEMVLECYAAGAYGYIAKPWNVEELQWLVRRAAEKQRLLEALAPGPGPRFPDAPADSGAAAFVAGMTRRLKEFELLTETELEEAQEELKRQAAQALSK